MRRIGGGAAAVLALVVAVTIVYPAVTLWSIIRGEGEP